MNFVDRAEELMEAFFFGDGGDEPEGWVAPTTQA